MVEGVTVISAAGGAAGTAGFMVSTSSSIVFDTDQDGDMEIVSGNGMGLLTVDFKEFSTSSGEINMFRFNNQRTGYFQSSQAGLLGDLNQDYIIDILDSGAPCIAQNTVFYTSLMNVSEVPDIVLYTCLRGVSEVLDIIIASCGSREVC